MKRLVVKPSELPESMKGQVVGIDIETEGLSLKDPICLISLHQAGTDVAYIVSLKSYLGNELQIISDDELYILKNFLTTIKAVGHNLQFDLSRIAYQLGVYIQPHFDTMVLARMMQLKHTSLKTIIHNIKPEYGKAIKTYEELGIDINNIRYNLSDQRIIDYSAMDAVYPFFIVEEYKDWIKDNKKVLKLEMEYLKVIIPLVVRGINVDIDKYREVMVNLKSNIDKTQSEINEDCGFNLRINSNKDLEKYLTDQKGIGIYLRTGKGAPSFSSEAINLMLENERDEGKRKAIHLIKELKHIHSVHNTSKTIEEWTQAIDGKLHPTIEQVGFDGTSRVYSKDPSINQYPREMRESFISSEGKKIVYFDWSGAELYLSAYWSKCAKLLEWFNSGKDLYTQISKELLNKEEITKEEREIAKTIVLATNYGSEGGAVSRKLNISFEEGKEFVNQYNALFPEIEVLKQKLIKYAKETGATTTMYGRKRKLDNLNALSSKDREKAYRRVFNTAIQSGLADLFKLAGIKSTEFKDEGVEYIFGVFDSFFLEVPESMSEDRIKEIVEFISDFSNIYPEFKFRYKLGIGNNWKEAEENSK